MAATTTDRIEKQVTLKATPARVWRALTDAREFGAWFRVNWEGPFIVGKISRGKITYPGYEHLTMEVLVEKMETEKLFAFRWHPYGVDPKKDYSVEPMTLVEFKLERAPEGTLLIMIESGFDGIPIERRAEAFRMNDGGWTEQIKNIDNYVAKNP